MANTKGKLKKPKKNQKETTCVCCSCVVVLCQDHFNCSLCGHTTLPFFSPKNRQPNIHNICNLNKKKRTYNKQKPKYTTQLRFIKEIFRFDKKNLDEFCKEQEKTRAEFSPLVSSLQDQYKGMFPK